MERTYSWLTLLVQVANLSSRGVLKRTAAVIYVTKGRTIIDSCSLVVPAVARNAPPSGNIATLGTVSIRATTCVIGRIPDPEVVLHFRYGHLKFMIYSILLRTTVVRQIVLRLWVWHFTTSTLWSIIQTYISGQCP